MSKTPLSEHCHIVIMAGGSGTRLWPLSRKAHPKQFQRLTSDRTLLQETFARALLVCPAERIYVCTAAPYRELVTAQLPEIAEANILIEPEARNTAPAIAFAAGLIRERDSEAVVATIASDHAIHNPEAFAESLKMAFSSVSSHREKLAIVGINPTRPDTGLGYIRMGAEFPAEEGERIFLAEDFKEKPDRKTAENYIADWRYLWNAGYFIFCAETFADWTEKYAPELHTAIRSIVEFAASGADAAERIAELYASIPKEAVEPLIVEKLQPNERLVIPAPLRWSDVGNWSTLFDFLSEKMKTDVVSTGKLVDLGSERVLALDEGKLIVTLGLEDVIIVDTKDALLVASRDKVEGEMKELLKKVADAEGDGYL